MAKQPSKTGNAAPKKADAPKDQARNEQQAATQSQRAATDEEEAKRTAPVGDQSWDAAQRAGVSGDQRQAHGSVPTQVEQRNAIADLPLPEGGDVRVFAGDNDEEGRVVRRAGDFWQDEHGGQVDDEDVRSWTHWRDA